MGAPVAGRQSRRGGCHGDASAGHDDDDGAGRRPAFLSGGGGDLSARRGHVCTRALCTLHGRAAQSHQRPEGGQRAVVHDSQCSQRKCNGLGDPV